MEKNNQAVNKDQYRQLADKGNTDAMVEYSLILCREKNGKPEKPEEVMKYLKMAVDKGNAYGMTYYANFLRAGYNIEKNLTEAERYYKMAIERETAKSRKAFAEYNYAEMLYNDYGRKKEAIQYYKMAADGGNIDAIKKYTDILYNGIFGVKANKQEAIKYYKMLADSDKRENTNAKYYYAKLLYERYADEESRKEAEKYFKMAEEEGSIGAAYFCACAENKPKEYMAEYLFKAFINEKNKEYFVRELKGLMTEKDAIKRKNIDFTIPVNENGDNLIDLFISNDLLTPKNTILINNLKFEELATVKEENRRKLVECLARNGKERYFEKFLNDKNFLKFEGKEEYEFKIKLLKLAFEDCNYGIANILIDSIGGIDKLKDDSIPEILTEMRKKVILDLDLFNSLLNRIGNKDEYFEKIDNLYLEGRNGYGQIKLTREFDKNSNPIEVIDSGCAHLKDKNSDKTIIGPKLYELRYKGNGIREATYYDKDGNLLVKIITDGKNKTNTFDFKGTKYDIESIENEEKRMEILQNFRNKVDETIASDFVDVYGFDCTLTNLEFAPIALEDKVNKKLNPTIFKDFNDREEIAEMIVKSIDNPEQEYILGISNDNHRTVMVVSNGRAMLVNTSGKPIDNSDYFTKDIQKIAREKYKESNEELNEKELKEKIKIREVSLTGQATGNCSLVGNVKTAKLLEQFKGDCKEFINSGIILAKLQKNGKKLSDVINVNNKNELENIENAAEKFSKVVKGLTDEKSKNLQLINDSEGLDMATKKISEFNRSKEVNGVGK